MDFKIKKEGKNIVVSMSKRKAKILHTIGDYSLTIRHIFDNASCCDYSAEEIRKVLKDLHIVIEDFFKKEFKEVLRT